MRLTLLSTSGNQAYIFASNRLREAVGASYLVACSTTDWIDQACRQVGGTRLQASSGNALVTTQDEPTARQLIQKVTRRALTEAPGLSITGVSIDIDTETPTADRIKAVFEEWQRHCGRTASATAARFQRLPIVAACQSTEWPARAWYSDISDIGSRPDAPESQEPIPQSAEVIAKRQVRRAADRRMAKLAGEGIRLVGIDELLTTVDWVGVVHADGNRLGELFRTAPDVLGHNSGTALGQLSDEVREHAEQALRHAVTTVATHRKGGRLPFVPLIVGGDDLTVLIDGKLALEFTTEYLKAFGRPPAEGSILRRVLGDREALTACAGVALVKRRYPFSEAYRLAEELCRSAKNTAQTYQGRVNGLDIHVLLDSQAGPLPKIRSTLASDDGNPLTDRPYLLPNGSTAIPAKQDWDRVCRRARVVRNLPTGGGHVVTRTQLYGLREELRADPELVRRRIATLRSRVSTDADRERLTALFPDDDNTLSGLYDLLELAPFVGGTR